MAIWKGKSKRKATGGRAPILRSKKKHELGIDSNPTTIGKKELRKQAKRLGGSKKTRLIKALYVNLADGAKITKVKVLDVLENKANRHFVRRDVLTKGARIKTSSGDAIITSRPSQEGVVNAKLIK